MPVDDPFDSVTPMLTYSEVRDLVAQLPQSKIKQLARGPIERDGFCRVCGALKPNGRAPEEGAAATLIAWHDDIGRSSWFLDHVEPKLFPGEIERANAEEKHIFGSLQYARCCVIYAAAALYIEQRRNARKPL